MKRFLTTTALALTLGTSAMADAHSMGFGTVTAKDANDFFASDLIGMRIYSSEAEYEADARVAAGAEAEWDDIGEINDLVVSRDGTVDAVILGIGGFLGLGERDVSVDMSTIRVVQQEGDAGDYFLVVKASKEQLEAAPEFDTSYRAERMAAAEAPVTGADATATTEVAATETAPETSTKPVMLDRPMVERDGYADLKADEIATLTASDIEGARVYGPADEDLGEVAMLVVEGDKLSDAVIDVGGFLGMGEKRIAVPFGQLQIVRASDGGDLRIYMDATEEKLEAMPAYAE